MPGTDTPPPLWSRGFGLVATRSIQTIAILGLVTIAAVAVMHVSVVVIPVVLALIITPAIYPFAEFLRRHRVPSSLAALIALFSIVIVLGLVIWLIVWAVIAQWDDLVTATQNGIDSLQGLLATLPFTISDDSLSQMWSWLTDFLQSSTFSSGALAGLSATATFFTGFGVFIVVFYFFLKDGPGIWEFLLRPFHGAGYERGWRAGRQATATFGHYVRGTTIVAAADAVGIGAGLFILQIPLALPLAVIVFVTAYIPIVGATLAGIVAALVALVANGPLAAVIVVGIVVLVNQIEGNLLQPLVMGRALKLHPLVVLIALTVGATLGGILGAIVAVPLTAAAWAVLQVWDGPDTPAGTVRPKAPEEAQRREPGVQDDQPSSSD